MNAKRFVDSMRGIMQRKLALALIMLGLLGAWGEAARVHAAACPAGLVRESCVLVERLGPAECDAQPAEKGQPTFQAALSVTGVLVEGALGLPGEPVAWAITLTNTGSAPGRDLVITVTPHPELRVQDAESPLGTVTVSDRAAVFTLPEVRPGQSVQMLVRTTVVRTPANGVLVIQVALAGSGPAGTFAQSAVGELFAPTGLPATGYPPGKELPGEGEPSVLAVGVAALTVVAAAAAYVWYRGRRVFV